MPTLRPTSVAASLVLFWEILAMVRRVMEVPALMEDVALIRRLAAAFVAAGYRLYLVGGSVRDRILGRPTGDLDFTTDAAPDATKAILAASDPTSLYAIGEKFGTIGSTFGDVRVEITTFRGEQYESGSRKPNVRFGSNLEEDLARRDFTMNAIAEDVSTGAMTDPFGGRADLSAGLIRAVGDPVRRFAEDPLRLLRAVRFVAQLGLALEPRTRDAIVASADGLRQISRERILDEMNRIMLSPRPGRGLRLLADLKLFDVFLPEALDLGRTTQGKRSKDVFEHTLRVVDRTRPDLVLRWAAFLHDIGKPRTITITGDEIHFPAHEIVGERLSGEILSRLRADSDLIMRVSRLAGLHMRANQYEDEWSDGAIRRLVREAGSDFELLLELSTADVTSYRAVKIEAAADRVRRLRHRVQVLEEQESLAEIKSPLDGVELMELFGKGPGPWIKPVKEYLLDLVLDGALAQDDKVEAAEHARQFLGEKRAEKS
jgi:poly(A) polymerase